MDCLPDGVIRVMIFPSGGGKCLSLPVVGKYNQWFSSYQLHLVCLPVICTSLSSLTRCTTGSIPTNWGQCRIEFGSYGLIYMSISVDRQGNRIFAPLILLGLYVVLI